MTISFEATPAELRAAGAIAKRFRALQKAHKLPQTNKQDIVMDLIATNANGCRLDFDKLLAATDFTVAHDVDGIARHLDRNDDSPTGGKLLRCFLPRCAVKSV